MLRQALVAALLCMPFLATVGSAGAPLCPTLDTVPNGVVTLEPGATYRIGVAAEPRQTPDDLGGTLVVPDVVTFAWEPGNVYVAGRALVTARAFADDDAHRGEEIPDLLFPWLVPGPPPPGAQAWLAQHGAVCIVLQHGGAVPLTLSVAYAGACTLCLPGPS